MAIDDEPAPDNRRKRNDVTFIQMLQDWLVQVAEDRGTTPTALRVAMLFAKHFNSKTLECFVGRETMAARLQVAPSMISTGVASLKAGGHVAVRSVRRKNFYLMVLKDPETVSPSDATGSNFDTQQVRKFEPNRLGNSYPNRQVTDPEQGSGANAPASHEQESYLDRYDEEVGTHAPEGVRPLSDIEEPEVSENALKEIASAYGGPIGDHTVAFASMMNLLEEGITHEQLVHTALHLEDRTEKLSDWLWGMTRRGRRDDVPSIREQRFAGAKGSDIPF